MLHDDIAALDRFTRYRRSPTDRVHVATDKYFTIQIRSDLFSVLGESRANQGEKNTNSTRRRMENCMAQHGVRTLLNGISMLSSGFLLAASDAIVKLGESLSCSATSIFP